jgi:hypothetical protein
MSFERGDERLDQPSVGEAVTGRCTGTDDAKKERRSGLDQETYEGGECSYMLRRPHLNSIGVPHGVMRR